MSDLSKFLRTLNSLIKQVINLYPLEIDLKLFHEKIKLLEKTNSQMIMKYFIYYILPYRKKIMNKNEEYFLDNEKIEKVKENIRSNNLSLKKSLNLKEKWNDLTNNNKDVIWKYFQVMIVLSEKWIINNSSVQKEFL